MKSPSKLPSVGVDAKRSKSNRVRLEKLLRQMLYSELSAVQENGFLKPDREFIPYRRVIE